MTQIRTGLTYDDVLLVPRRSRVRSRQDVSTRSRFTPGIELEVPIVSANMDTVTMAPMAVAMAQLGGIGVLHRFLAVEQEAAEVRRVKRYLTHVVGEPYLIEPGRTLAHARAEARRLAVTGFVVVDPERRLLGLLTARDMLAGEDGDRVEELMTPRDRLVTAPSGIGLPEARRLLTSNRIEKLPLVDEGGRVSGLVTFKDLSLAERYPRATRDSRGRLRVAAAIGIRGDYLERAGELIAAEVDALVLDIAHGHADAAIEAVAELKGAWPELEIVAGNVATGDGVADLVAAGADAVKVGIGPGFACTTRLVAGVGVPQLSAVLECAAAARTTGVPLIADGGIRRAGHVATAMGAGASTVMVGSLFAGRVESPGDVVRRRGQLFKVYRGMASRSAAAARLAIEGRGDALDQYVAEGEEMEFPLRGSVTEVVEELHGGLRSGMSYVDAADVPEFWEKASFVRQTEAGERESHPGLGMSRLYANGVVVTMDDAGTEHESGWLLVEGGTIAAVDGGPEPESGPGTGTERVDLRGGVVTPGLVNTHHHLYQTLTRARAQEADLFTWLRELYPLWSRIDAESEYAAARTGLAELALSGCTTVFDHHYVFPSGREGLIEAEVQAAREIGVRIVASRGSMDLGVSDGGLPPDELVEELDAVLAETERLASALHEPGPGAHVQIAVAPCSPFSVTGRLMEESAALARRLGLPLHTHLAETLEEEEYCLELYGCRPVEYLDRLGWLADDVWCAHCVHLSERDIAQFASTGTGVAHCPTSNLRLGAGVAPVRALVDAGVRVGLGVDGSASNERSDLFFEVKQALLVARGRGGGAAMTAREAIRLGTRGGAAVLRRDDIGSLEAGKCADFAVWRTDGLALGGADDFVAGIVFAGPQRPGLLVVGGAEVVRDGALVNADESEIAQAHRAQARKFSA